MKQARGESTQKIDRAATMVRALLGLAAAKDLAAGSMHYAGSGIVGLAFGFVAAVAIVAIAIFGCADLCPPSEGSKGSGRGGPGEGGDGIADTGCGGHNGGHVGGVHVTHGGGGGGGACGGGGGGC